MPLSEDVLRTLQIYIFFFERSGVKLAVRSQQMPYIATVDNVARRAEPNNQATVIETYLMKERMQNTLSQVNGCPQEICRKPNGMGECRPLCGCVKTTSCQMF